MDLGIGKNKNEEKQNKLSGLQIESEGKTKTSSDHKNE